MKFSKDEWVEACNDTLICTVLMKKYNLTHNQYRYLTSKFHYRCLLDGHAKDERGNLYGKLTVIDFAGRNSRGEILWVCQCNCGQKVIRSGVELRKDQSNPMCADCFNRQVGERFLKDLTGKTFGLIKVLERTGSNSSGNATYKCICTNCGTIFEDSSGNLPNRISCGCLRSKGEYLISTLLTELDVHYKTQFTFSDCKDKGLLKFDFAIFKEESLFCLIEFQGRQHYQEWDNPRRDGTLEDRQRRDNIKREYCKKNHIRLIEIPYYDMWRLNSSYLKKLLSI